MAMDAGEPSRAAGFFRDGLAVAWDHRHPFGVAEALDGVAGVAAVLGQPERAARLLGAAEARREATDMARTMIASIEHERHVAATRAALGEAAFAAAYAGGRALPLEEAVAEALACADLAVVPPASRDRGQTHPTAPAPTRERLAAGPATHGLTPRELEVLRLLAEGRGDREIGEALFISPRTVMRHVAGILAKLGVGNRTAAANLAVRRDLV